MDGIQIYHVNGDRKSGYCDFMEHRDKGHRFPEDFMLVAIVHTVDIDRAYYLSQNIDWDWVKNEDVTVIPEKQEGCRSSSIGDVFVKAATGEAYVVMGVGFKKIEKDEEITYNKVSRIEEVREVEGGAEVPAEYRGTVKDVAEGKTVLTKEGPIEVVPEGHTLYTDEYLKKEVKVALEILAKEANERVELTKWGIMVSNDGASLHVTAATKHTLRRVFCNMAL